MHTHLTWHSESTSLQQQYLEQFKALDGDTEGRLFAQTYLDGSTAVYHGEVIGMGFLPKLYDTAALDSFSEIIDTTYRILEKMTLHYLEDEHYRKLFRFSPLLEKLILLPTGYATTIPIARIDIFLNEETGSFSFCEFNTDGSSAMNEDREICDSLADTPTLRAFNGTHAVTAQELFDPWVKACMDVYDSSVFALPDPVVAIMDYTDIAVVHEQLEFRNRFEHHGVSCLVADVSSLEYVDGVLYARDVSKNHPAHTIPMRVDIIYRRAVTIDLLQELQQLSEDELQTLFSPEPKEGILRGASALVAAVAAKKVCMIGGFKTQVAHSKASFCLLHHPHTLELLTTEEREFVQEHVPYTTWLSADSLDITAVKESKERWIIKPVDGYGTQGVHAGKSFDQEAWSALIDEKLKEDYIIQEYCPQYQTPNTLPIPLDHKGERLFNNVLEAEECKEWGSYDPLALAPYNILTGLYSYNATFGGVYVRAGQDALIVGFKGGVALGSLLVDFVPDPKTAVCSREIME